MQAPPPEASNFRFVSIVPLTWTIRPFANSPPPKPAAMAHKNLMMPYCSLGRRIGLVEKSDTLTRAISHRHQEAEACSNRVCTPIAANIAPLGL